MPADPVSNSRTGNEQPYEIEEEVIHVPADLYDEDRRIYERSLRFVLFIAAEKIWPEARIRIEYTYGRGVYGHLEGHELSVTDILTVRENMREIIAADLPFQKRTTSEKQAVRILDEQGQADGKELLKRKRDTDLHLYCCCGNLEYFYGTLLPSSGCVKVFDLFPYNGGFVLMLPDPADPSRVADFHPNVLLQSVFDASKSWCTLLGVRNMPDISDLLEARKLRNFIRVNEALQDRSISEIAEQIHLKDRRVILVAGPSSSGKTTFAGRLGVHLQKLGHPARRVSMDDYYRDRDKIPPEPDGHVDLEAITALDIDLMQTQINQLLNGDEILPPRFNFSAGCREWAETPIRLKKQEILILEGIHGLNPMLCDSLPRDQIYRVFVSALTCLNLDDHNRIRTTDVRLLRRITRDHLFRGTSPADTLAMWPSVRAGEEKWIFPCQEQADHMFNTALHYELPVLKHYAYGLLKAIPESSPVYLPAHRLVMMLSCLPDPDPSLFTEIPPLSLLREFIGGGTMEEPG